jgi:hypothetical protein
MVGHTEEIGFDEFCKEFVDRNNAAPKTKTPIVTTNNL